MVNLALARQHEDDHKGPRTTLHRPRPYNNRVQIALILIGNIFGTLRSGIATLRYCWRMTVGSVPGYPQGVPLLYDGRACRAVVE
jgi:hypothetical protein